MRGQRREFALGDGQDNGCGILMRIWEMVFRWVACSLCREV